MAEKLSHEAVKFEHPAKDQSQRCSRCHHFIFGSPPQCQIVKDPIHWNDWCDRYKARK